LQVPKKILSILIKVLIGIGSFFIIYLRLKTDFTPEKLQLLYTTIFSAVGMACFLFCLLLIPLNWGIEAYKWKIITAPIQWVSYRTATKSVYSGICLGNLAPGRATEFLAKIIFFKPENRSKITVLHFVGGMFQLSITILAGFAALMIKARDLGGDSSWMTITTTCVGIVLLLLLAISIYRINDLLNYISRKMSKEQEVLDFQYRFSPKSLLQLFGFSALRYAVFFLQFFLLMYLFDRHVNAAIFPGIALYFLITTTLPMISVLEAAIRAAVALLVFKDSGVSSTALALSSVMIWMTNIIIPSIFGYYILIRQKFNFKIFKKDRKK
jgi:hypothetical protein